MSEPPSQDIAVQLNPLGATDGVKNETKGGDIETGDLRKSLPTPLTEVTSTNMLLLGHNCSLLMVCISIGVSLMQITLFIVIMVKSVGFKPPTLNFELVLVRLFVSIYLAVYLLHSISFQLQKLVISSVKNFGDSTPLLKCLGTMISFLLLILTMSCMGTLTCISQVRTDYRWGPIRRMMSLYLEILVLIVSCCATLLITKEQTDIISTVFNFAGLLLILELDDIVGRMLKIKILCADIFGDEQSEDRDIAAFNCGVFCLVFFPAFIYLLT